MNLKKILAGVLACCVVGGALPSVDWTVDKPVITASAEDEYTEGTYELLKYKNYGDHIEITGCDESATSVVIPAEIDGLPVTSIGYCAFEECTSLTKIIIPDSVKSIGYCAFEECTSLTEITIPDSVTSIGDRAFFECTGLTEITIPNSVTSIGRMAFVSCEKLTSVTLPDSIIGIDEAVFLNCTSLESITIPDSVTVIVYSAFEGCSGLISLTIPDSVTIIANCAFCSCTKLTEITILNPNCEISDNEFIISNGRDEKYVPYFNGTIYGYENSTAQAYAEKYNRKFVSLGSAPEKESEMGDIDGDGIIDSSDASFVLTEYSLLSTGKEGNLSDSVKKLADLNKDGTIDASDASLILAYYSHVATGGTDSIEVFLGKQGY